MNAKRERKLTDPSELAASAAFSAAWKRSGISQQAVAEAASVTPATVSHWATGRLAVPAIRAQHLAAQLGVDPADISNEWRILKAQMGQSQPQRLDPGMMGEALVSVLKVQESSRRAFMPGKIAEALCAIYEIRETLPSRLTREQVKAFDVMVKTNVERVWGEEESGSEADGGIVQDRGEKPKKPAAKARRSGASQTRGVR